MATKIHQALVKALYKLLRPLVKILIRYGVSYPMAADVLKRVYVDVAECEFKEPNRKKVPAARLSLLTGIHRKDIARLKKNPDSTQEGLWERQNYLARIIFNWCNHPDYQTDGNPLVLPVHGEGISFQQLVIECTGDVPVVTTLDELMRIGCVEKNGEQVTLVNKAYYPADDTAEKLWVLGNSGSDLYATIEHNLAHKHEESYYQSYLYYDNIPEEVMQEVRKRANKNAQQFMKETNAWLSQYDRDGGKVSRGTGRHRAGIGIYFFANDVEQPAQTTTTPEEATADE